jgi:hypothetical protein
MEEYDKMMVNNLICETLHPENTVAQIYKILPELGIEDQEILIKQVNEAIKNNNIYKIKSK